MEGAHMSFNIFPAKILLFGEYTLITGSNGLAMPLPQFQARFEKNKNEPSTHLQKFCAYLKGSPLLSETMDLDKFEADIDDGLTLQSDIPHGYGIGSSGALCAAVYDRYAHHSNKTNLNHLKDIMALMENFYHGTSSGVDCLISLMNKPMMIRNRNMCDIIPSPDLSTLGHFYLYDSGISRKTAEFVHKFLHAYETNTEYQSSIETLAQDNNQMIDHAINGNQKDFQNGFQTLSAKQYDLFADMIPNNVKHVWKYGLDSGEYFFKLCGAGGGGFFLVYATDAVTSIPLISISDSLSA